MGLKIQVLNSLGGGWCKKGQAAEWLSEGVKSEGNVNSYILEAGPGNSQKVLYNRGETW